MIKLQVGDFILNGKITGIRQDLRWFYVGCSLCHKKIMENHEFYDNVGAKGLTIIEVTWSCTNTMCTNMEVTGVPRY